MEENKVQVRAQVEYEKIVVNLGKRRNYKGEFIKNGEGYDVSEYFEIGTRRQSKDGGKYITINKEKIIMLAEKLKIDMMLDADRRAEKNCFINSFDVYKKEDDSNSSGASKAVQSDLPF